MHVQQIELVILRDLRHARRQRQVVGWIFEERIVRDRDLVVEDPLFAAGEPEGLRIGDEMHLVAQRGELDAQLGGDHSAAAVGRITGNADFHRGPQLSCTQLSWTQIASEGDAE